MKKLTTMMAALLLMLTAGVVTSCSEDHYYDYRFELDRAIDAYFDRYGDFGTDDNTTADWFSRNFPYATDGDYRRFINEVSVEINNSRTLMARYLNGEWEGPLRMYYKDNSGTTVYDDYQVVWHFELSASSDVKGRGVEYRYQANDMVQTSFSWCVNGYGGIEISYDTTLDNGEYVNMLIAYNNLDCLNNTQFKGTSVGVNIDEEDDFNLTKRLPQSVSANGAVKETNSKTFSGKQFGAASVERNITIKQGHR